MTKERLVELGVSAELADKVVAELDEQFVPKYRLTEMSAKKKQAEDALKERDEQLEALKGAAGKTETLKAEIEKLQAANSETEKKHAAELKQLRRDALDERLLAEAKALNVIAVKPFLAVIDGGVDDEGYTALRKQHIDALTKAESTKFLFADAEPVKGAAPAPSGVRKPDGGVTNPFAKDTFNEAEQMRLYRENKDAAIAMAKAAGYQFL